MTESDDPRQNLTVACQVEITGTDVVIVCHMSRYDDTLLSTAYQRSMHTAKACLAIYTFESSIGLDIAITEFIDPSGTRHPMVFRSAVIAGLCHSYSLPSDFEAITQIVLKDTLLFLALIDLAESITQPDTALLCARAIDRIRHAIAGRGVRHADGWPKVHEALRTDAAYLQFITEHSKAPRHGERFNHPPNVTTEVSRRSWIIVDRYIAYRRHGGVPLPLDKFPLLAG
jgi:hypothetical protein